MLTDAAAAKRQVLVDHARARHAMRRGPVPDRVTVDGLDVASGRSLDVLALNDALQRLARTSPRQAQIAELRLFVGLGLGEIASALDLPEHTARREWTVARIWLQRVLRLTEYLRF